MIEEYYFRTPASMLARTLLVLAIVVALFAGITATGSVFAPVLGLGVEEDFILYKWVALSRSETVYLAGKVVLGSALFSLVVFYNWRQWMLLWSALTNLVLIIAAIIFTLFVLETGFRLLNGVPFWPIENHIAKQQALLTTQTDNEYHEDLGWVLKPGISGNPNDADTSFTTGDHGIRMNSGEIKPVPSGAILAVGDSFTAGSEVGDRHSWPAQLERLLQSPVVNAGVGGWGAGQIMLRAEELALILKPHTIVVSLLADDILRSGYRVYGSANKPWFDIDSNGDLVRHNKPVPVFTGSPNEVGFSPLGYFHIVTFVADRLGFGTWLRRGSQNTKNGNDPVAVSCKLLERAHKRFSAQNIQMLFLLQYGGDERHDLTAQKLHADEVITCAREVGIETIDTWPALLVEYQKGIPSYKALFVMHDNNRLYGHMSSKGNALIAKLIADKLNN